MQFASVYERTGSSVRAERAEAGLDGAHALRPVVALADAEPLLDAVVVRVEVGRAERRAARADDAARLVPLRVVLRVRAQRDLRVDRRRCRRRSGPATSADRAAGAAVDQREPDRPPEVVRRLRLPAREVGGGPVRAELEQQHAAAALRELARHDAAARAGADDHDVEPLAHRDPQVRPVLRQARGEGRVEVDLRPGAGRVDAGRDEVAVERLDRERAHPEEVRRADVLARSRRRRRDANAASAAAARAVVHPREQRVDVDRRAHARRAGDDRVAHPFHHPGRLGVEHLQVGHAAMINQAD